MKKNTFISIVVIYFFLIAEVIGVQPNFFEEGIKLYKKNKFEKSKVQFEKDIVFNPKNEKSY